MEFEGFRRRAPELNLTPLIDVLFILVIFVVLAANFQRIQDLGVTLPAAKSTGTASQEALTLTIDASGGLALAGTPLDEKDLGAQLKSARARHDSLLVVADRAVDFERAVAALGEAAAAGFKNVSVATREPQ